MKEGVYIGMAGQLIEVHRYSDLDNAYSGVLSLRVSDKACYWLESGGMSEDLLYLINGFEYLGEL
jgi:hypothetical protein